MVSTVVWLAGTGLVLWLVLRALRAAGGLTLLGLLGLAQFALLPPLEVTIAAVMRSRQPAGEAGQVVADWALLHQWFGLGWLLLGGTVLLVHLRVGRIAAPHLAIRVGVAATAAGLVVRNLV